jgi:Eco57I restriction-modification methylase
MRFVTDLSKGILGRPDSVELWERIVNQIPAAVLMKPDVTILNVAFGHGTEADVLVKRMVSLGRSPEGARAAIRLVDKYTTFVNFARLRGYTKVDKADFQKWAEEYKGMKFDIVIGNPPYQGEDQANAKLWKDFLVLAGKLTKDDGFICFVIPSSWAKPVEGKALAANAAINDLMFNHKILEVSFDGSKYFPSVGIDISWFVLQKTRIAEQNVFVRSEAFGEILKKVNAKGKMINLRSANETAYKPHSGRKIDESKPKFAVLYHRPGQYTNIDDPVRKLKKVVFPRRFGYDALADVHGEYALPESCAFIEHDGPTTALTWFKSKIVRSLMKVLSFTPQTDFALLKSIKAPSLSTVWTDEMLYKHFNLTQDEIDLIERTVK